jgi:hypothetical protein
VVADGEARIAMEVDRELEAANMEFWIWPCFLCMRGDVGVRGLWKLVGEL